MENLPLILILVYLIYKALKKGLHKSAPYEFYGAAWLFLMAFTAITIMIFSPNFPARSTSPLTIFIAASIVGFGMLLYKNNIDFINKKLKAVVCTVVLAYMAITMGNTLYCYNIAHDDNIARSAEIKTQLEAGVKDLVVKPFRVLTSKYVFIGDVRAQKQYFGNLIIARYYHVDSIRRSCNYKFPSTVSHDYAIFQMPVAGGVCTLDRGDPEDPNDILNIEYLKTHPEEKAKLDFRHYKKIAKKV